MPKHQRHNKKIVLAAVQKDGLTLKQASENLRNNQEIVMAAVQQDGRALQFASKDLRNNQEIVLAAVKENELALRYASENLRNNEKIVMAAVHHRSALVYASENLQNNEKIVMAAVQNHVSALQYASEILRNNEKIVMAAVQNHGLALQYASDNLRNNEKIVMAAVKQHGDALKHASEDLQNNQEIVKDAVKNHGWAIHYASEELRNNREIVMAAVQQDGRALQFASKDLRNNQEIVLAAVQNHGSSLQYASENLRNNQDIVMATVKQYSDALQYASEYQRNKHRRASQCASKIPKMRRRLTCGGASSYIDGPPIHHATNIQLNTPAQDEESLHTPAQDDESLHDNQSFILIRTGFVSKQTSFSQNKRTENLSANHERVVVNGLIFEYADGSRTGKIIEFVSNTENNKMCYFDIEIHDDSIIEQLILKDNWININDGVQLTHICFSRINDENQEVYRQQCMFENVTLFLSDNSYHTFGDSPAEKSCEPMKIKSQTIDLTHNREAVRELFENSDIAYPLLSSDIGYRLKEKRTYKGCQSLLHKIIIEAMTNSRSWMFVDDRCARSWDDVLTFIEVCRSTVYGDSMLREQIVSKEGWLEWTPLQYAMNGKAPKEVLDVLKEIYLSSR